MKTFKIVHSFDITGKNCYLLNQPFFELTKNEDFMHGRISSYHQKSEAKADWLTYDQIPNGKIILATIEDAKEFTIEEALLFTASENGIPLSRDNLFMLPHLFKERLIPKKGKKAAVIVSLMGEKFLPDHLNYDKRKICPKFTAYYGKDDFFLTTNYDWAWIDEPFSDSVVFAFFQPRMFKPLF